MCTQIYAHLCKFLEAPIVKVSINMTGQVNIFKNTVNVIFPLFTGADSSCNPPSKSLLNIPNGLRFISCVDNNSCVAFDFWKVIMRSLLPKFFSYKLQSSPRISVLYVCVHWLCLYMWHILSIVTSLSENLIWCSARAKIIKEWEGGGKKRTASNTPGVLGKRTTWWS